MKRILEEEVTEVLRTLHEYLERLENLSNIHDLVETFDAPALLARAEEIAKCQDAIQRLHQRLLSLFDESGVSSIGELENQASHNPDSPLHDMCRRIRQQFDRIQQQQSINALQLSAAQQVAQSILTQAGLVEASPTYGPGKR